MCVEVFGGAGQDQAGGEEENQGPADKRKRGGVADLHCSRFNKYDHEKRKVAWAPDSPSGVAHCRQKERPEMKPPGQKAEEG